MPYIAATAQDAFSDLLEEINKAEIKTAGELNFLFTRLAIRYIESNSLRYAFMNDVMGALEGAKLEFYRRVAEPYEAQKAFEADQDGVDPYARLT